MIPLLPGSHRKPFHRVDGQPQRPPTIDKVIHAADGAKE